MVEAKGLSQLIRKTAEEKYVLPAIEAGYVTFSLRVKDLMEDVRRTGISPDHKTPQFCTAIQKATFLKQNGLVIEAIDGPPSKLSTTVVVHYRVLPRKNGGLVTPSAPESPAQRAFRLIGRMSGLMKDEIAAHGGTEGYMRWVRSEDRHEAA